MEDFTMKTTKKALKALIVALLSVNVSFGCGYGGYTNFDFNISCQLWGNREVGINNPLNPSANLSRAYTITLDSPIIIKPTKIDMNENIVADGSAEEATLYRIITQVIPDPLGKDECLRYPKEEFMRGDDGEKICELKKEDKPQCDEWRKDKKNTGNCPYQVEDRAQCESKNQWKKYPDWTDKDPYTDAKAGQCKTRQVNIYTTGVTFTPNYDDSPIDISKQYCKAGETQGFESIEETIYKSVSESDENTSAPTFNDENGNAIIDANGNSAYYNYIHGTNGKDGFKKEAMNVNNYYKTINKVLCTADYENSNLYAYIVGAVVNHYHPFFQKEGLRKIEVESLVKINLSMGTDTSKEADCRCCWGKGDCKGRGKRDEWLNVSFETKENWYNNQRIYEYEMYRPFRRPDGTTFYLYERQGFFINKDDGNTKVCTDKTDTNCVCKDCARDDELNG